ncbi:MULTISPECIES: preprotein translocase subunit SecG [Clostridium]|uniref:Protein-export membrane protein SecG n=1 Tax=Clostridium senegalense TaxID=1465809 RepID=A0A6M0H1N7_9CLOT|nr:MULTISPECIES: preprotein translocase subunit SecG [Clostridium]MBU5226164.1 preprotein translocase subunit SecG [Clostridium senegalense]NEU03811.1 preprotein translocase subunit SecG [Clostridium senegalense]
MKTALTVIQILSAVLLMIVILLQPSKGNGLQGLVTGSSDTFYSKNKTKTKESFLIKLTVFFAIVFVGSVILINAL